MLYRVYAIYDSKSEAYYPPFFQATTGLAIRYFTELANDQKTTIGKYPHDYALYEIGTYDDGTAILEPQGRHTHHGKAIEFVQEEEKFPLERGTQMELEKAIDKAMVGINGQ